MSLRLKLLCVLVPATLVLCALVGWILARSATFHEMVFVQESNRDLAYNLVKDNVLYTGEELNPIALENVFHTLMVVNPAIEVYLLKHDGSMYMYSAPEGVPIAKWVDLGPIKTFIDGSQAFPIHGSNPRDPARPAIFSTAPITIGNQHRGYLYIVLSDRDPGSWLSGPLRQRTWLTIALAVAAIAALGSVAAWTVMRLITRRIQRLDSAVARFRLQLAEPEAVQPISWEGRVLGGVDEIDSVAAQTVQMSRTIVTQINRLATIDKLRRQLIANVSHDLRTPLTTIEGYLQTLLVKAHQLDDEKRQQYLEIAYRSSRRLRKLIRELFELSCLEADCREIAPEEFCIAELVSDVVQKLAIIAERRGVSLKVNVDPVAAHARGEIALIERVLDNLIINAIAHSPKNSTVLIKLEPGPDRTVRVAVIDQGAGIALQDLPYVFDHFYRPGESEKTRAMPGAGLGLAIVRRIMELHKSRVEALSVQGDGSTFSFWLPCPSRQCQGGSRKGVGILS